MFQMTAEQRKAKWFNKWNKYHTEVLNKINDYLQNFGLAQKNHLLSNKQKLHYAKYITALMLLQKYSCAIAISDNDADCATAAKFLRAGNFKWGNKHGSAVARALKDHVDPFCDNPEQKNLTQMLCDVQNEVRDAALNPKGDLHTILSVIQYHCNVTILGEDNKIVFEPDYSDDSQVPPQDIQALEENLKKLTL